MKPDSTYRVGRCNSCRSRPSFYWPASSGMTLGDLRCPRCGGILDKTSRMAHYLRGLTEIELERAMTAAIERTRIRIAENEQVLRACREDPREEVRERWTKQWQSAVDWERKHLETLTAGQQKIASSR